MGGKKKEQEHVLEEEEEEELVQVDASSPSAVRVNLEDHIPEYFRKRGYKLDHKTENIRMVLMAFLIVLALIAQFHTKYTGIEFPHDAEIVVPLMAVFGIGTMVLMLITEFIEQDIVSIAIPKNTSSQDQHIVVRASLPRYEDHFQISVEHRGNPSKIEEKWYLGDLYDGEGYFDSVTFDQKMRDLVNKLQTKKKN